MARGVLPAKLKRICKGLFVRPHEAGQLLMEAIEVSIFPLQSQGMPHRTGRQPGGGNTHLDEQLPVFRVHFVL